MASQDSHRARSLRTGSGGDSGVGRSQTSDSAGRTRFETLRGQIQTNKEVQVEVAWRTYVYAAYTRYREYELARGYYSWETGYVVEEALIEAMNNDSVLKGLKEESEQRFAGLLNRMPGEFPHEYLRRRDAEAQPGPPSLPVDDTP